MSVIAVLEALQVRIDGRFAVVGRIILVCRRVPERIGLRRQPPHGIIAVCPIKVPCVLDP